MNCQLNPLSFLAKMMKANQELTNSLNLNMSQIIYKKLNEEYNPLKLRHTMA